MKKAKKSKASKEPTLGEFFDFVKEKFETTEGKLGAIDQRFGHLEQRVDVRAKGTNDRIDSIDARLSDVQRKLTKVESKVEDIQDDLTSALHASDNDGLAILNHEHRISHLEKLGSIKSVPPKHLAGLE